MQVVSQLELQLQKERDRLQAMMHHLHMSKQLGSPEPLKESPSPTKVTVNPVVPQPAVSMGALVSAVRSPVLQATAPNVPGPIRRRISDKSALSLAGGEVLHEHSKFVYDFAYMNDIIFLLMLQHRTAVYVGKSRT